MNFFVEVEMGKRQVEKSSTKPLYGHHEKLYIPRLSSVPGRWTT